MGHALESVIAFRSNLLFLFRFIIPEARIRVLFLSFMIFIGLLTFIESNTLNNAS